MEITKVVKTFIRRGANTVYIYIFFIFKKYTGRKYIYIIIFERLFS